MVLVHLEESENLLEKLNLAEVNIELAELNNLIKVEEEKMRRNNFKEK